ncbi:MAG TPA: hypothetical protein VGV37_18675 [Aliidongia sp.]|uniref:hypothetical protein n=1 Tax=Aliidongia sp. TaxID=1914230 RepID=UPI002DDD07E4|nr:hypothetical protein [Aliidongia sp.]HEV2676558.1 hypothetical protein [Aliidongia sp.]
MSIIEPPPALAPTAPQDERAILARLRTLHETAQIRVAIDRKKLSHMDFPLALEADGNRWAYAIVILVGLVWWHFGLVPGLTGAVVGFLIYQTIGQRWVAHRLERRVHDRGLGELDNWRKLWRFGGVILTDPTTGETCQGPEGRWMGFVEAIDRRTQP